MNKPKTQAHQSYYYSLTGMTLFGAFEIVGTAGVKNTDYYVVDEDVAPAGVTMFLVPRTPILGIDIIAIVAGLNSDTNNDSDAMTVAAYSQADSAIMVLNSAAAATWTDIDVADVNTALQVAGYGSAGDLVELVGVPNPTVDANWTAVHYVRSLDVTPGQMIEPVPSEMEPQRVTRRIRQEQTVDVSAEYVDNNTGFSQIRGRETCIMVEQHEDGGPVVSEYWILGNAAIQDAPPSAPDNAAIMISAGGSYRRRLIYAP